MSNTSTSQVTIEKLERDGEGCSLFSVAKMQEYGRMYVQDIVGIIGHAAPGQESNAMSCFWPVVCMGHGGGDRVGRSVVLGRQRPDNPWRWTCTQS
jgi:hypothetical protein